tara:strand:+ start:1188 stop:2090 length:903 start_codon:yes stop_codon:yes gene_type:complete
MNKPILVTGGSGQVGKELQHLLPNGYYISSKDCNLTKEQEVDKLFKENNFNTVIHLAAKVGGILDNINNPTDYYADNVLMNTLILNYSLKYNIKRFIGVLSTCIYPDTVDEYPLKEEVLHQGPPTRTNFSYGIAKRGMAVHIDAINKQHNKQYCYIMPCNLYGIYDKFDERSHFVSALINKIYQAKKNNAKEITLFGTGTPFQQVMNARDLARIIRRMIDQDVTESFNVASPDNMSINNIAEIALEACGCSYMTIKYDSTKPDGQYRKDACTKKMHSIFPDFKFTNLRDGIKEVYDTLDF